MTFNINRPGIDRRAPTQTQVDQMIEYLEGLAMTLNYSLNHLDQNNLTEDAVEKMLNENLVERIENAIGTKI